MTSTSAPPDQTTVEQGSARQSFSLRERPEFALVPLTFVVVVAIWEIGVRVLEVPAFVLPPPSAVAVSLFNQVQTANYWKNVRVTSVETLIGYSLGVTIAFVLGVAVSQFRLFEKTIFPYVVAFQTVPKTALAPLFVIWFGFGLTSKVVTAALVSFFPMLINVIEGLRSASREQIELVRSLDGSRVQVFRLVQLPNAMPFIFAGLDIGIVFAVIGAVVAEWVGARAGLGYQLLQYIYDFNIAGLFGVLVTLSLLGYIAHSIIRFFQRRYAFWSDSSRTLGA